MKTDAAIRTVKADKLNFPPAYACANPDNPPENNLEFFLLDPVTKSTAAYEEDDVVDFDHSVEAR